LTIARVWIEIDYHANSLCSSNRDLEMRMELERASRDPSTIASAAKVSESASECAKAADEVRGRMW